jgi:hypothetical protein
MCTLSDGIPSSVTSGPNRRDIRALMPNSLVLFPLPILVVGKGAGRVKGDRHIVAPERTPMANLLWSLADKVGTPLDKFGASTRKLSTTLRHQGGSN